MEWKINDRFPKYKISDRGDVISLHTNKYMTPVYENSHRRYQLRDVNKKVIDIRADILVCETFNGPCPKGYVVSHGDGGIYDYSAKNLKWDKYEPKLTFSEQCKLKRVRLIETGEIFDSIYECSEKMNIKIASLKKCLKSSYVRTSEGYRFEFVD